jgi:ABC-2 type transport system permease protein
MATETIPARPAPDAPMAIANILTAYWLEVKYDTLNLLRTPAAAVPFLLIPVLVYALFGVLIGAGSEENNPLGPGAVNYVFAGMCTMAVLMPGIFSGVGIALERDGGLHRLKRALPMPGGANLFAKMAAAMIVSAAALTLVVLVALVAGRITLTGTQVLIMWTVLVLGSIPMCALGFFIGSFTSGSAAPAFSNLLLLPMMWLSGMFIPLPEFMRPWVVVWPAFHLDQLALGLAGVKEFTFIPLELAAGVLVAVTVLFGGVAIHRLARVG